MKRCFRGVDLHGLEKMRQSGGSGDWSLQEIVWVWRLAGKIKVWTIQVEIFSRYIDVES